MTAEKLHDALSLLPADLIAATDRLRTQPPRRVIPWHRLATIAACLAVVLLGSWLFSTGLFSGGSTEKAAPMEIAAQDAAELEEAYPAQGENRTITSGSTTLETQAAWEEAGEVVLDEPAGQAEYAAESTFAAVANELASQSVETPCIADSAACYSSESRITLIRSREELEEYFERYAYRYDFDAMKESCTGFDENWFTTHDLLLIALHEVPTEQACEVTAITQRDGIWEVCIANYLNGQESTRTDRHILIGTEKDQIPNEDSVLLIFE